MNFIPQDDIDIAVLYKIFVVAQESDDLLQVDDIVELFEFPIGPKRIDLALQNLASEAWIRRSARGGQPATITPLGYKHLEQALVRPDSFAFHYASRGDEWLQRRRLALNGVPASDRIVLKSDNQPAINAISADLDVIESALATDNLLGADLGDERQLIQGEISAAKTLVKQPRFRSARIVELLLPALKYLADKFSGASIGEVAKRLIQLLLELL